MLGRWLHIVIFILLMMLYCQGSHTILHLLPSPSSLLFPVSPKLLYFAQHSFPGCNKQQHAEGLMKRLKDQKHFLDDHSLGTPYPDGHVFFREGELCDAIYIVQVGQVRIFTTLDSGHEIELALVGPGEIFGITSLFIERPRIATAATVGDSSILKIERAKLLNAIHDDPTLVFYILKSMSVRSRRLKDRLAASESRHIERDMNM